jgi:hypothetical protein
MSEKQFYGIWKEQEIQTKGGGKFSVIKASFRTEELKRLLEISEENRGWVNLDLTRRREPSDKGQTHYASLNTWKPKEEQEKPQQTETEKFSVPAIKYESDIKPEDLPF